MAIPANPTLASLVTEGLFQAGKLNPTTAEITRAQDEFMESIKNDVFLSSAKVQKKLKSMFVTSILVTTIGVNRYSLPIDYAGDLTVTILDGSHTGILQAGAVGAAMLESGEDADNIVGKFLLIISGTGVGSCSQIQTYNPVTKVATVNPNFTTAPASGSGYRIIDSRYHLDITDSQQIDMQVSLTNQRPTKYAPIGDADYGEILFNHVPDKTYGIQLRYYVDLALTDLNATVMATVYRKWRNLWIQGVKARTLNELHDEKAEKEMDRYYAYLEAVINDELGGQGYGRLQIKMDRG